MKRFLIFITSFVTFVESNRNNDTFFPRFPVGEYQANIKSLLPCDSTKRNKIQINVHLNKISTTKAEFEGNWTIGIPLDDTLTFHIDFDQKSSNGGWANKVISLKKDKACSTLKYFFRQKYWNNLGFTDSFPCPVHPGVYFMKGLPAYNLENVLHNVPKLLIYGTFRNRFRIMKNNEEIACCHWTVELKRPWETP